MHNASAPRPVAHHASGGAVLGIYPFELFTVGVGVAIVAYLRWHGLRIDWHTVEYTLWPMVKTLPKVAGIGLALHAAVVLLRRQPLWSYLREIVRPASLLLWLRVWSAAMLMTYAYMWLKVSIPLLTPRLYDAQLWRIDQLLHLGVSPNVLLVEGLKGSWLLGLLDSWYALWVSTVLWTLCFFFASTDYRLRRSFALSCAVLWLIGACIYLALPALGPFFSSPEVFAPLGSEMPRAAQGQMDLAENYRTMLTGRAGILRQFNPVKGVAALPSLHVGAHWLFALWARRRFPPLFVLGGLATFLTLLTSVLSGWHYAVDGYVGMLLAWGAFRLALRWEPDAESAPVVES